MNRISKFLYGRWQLLKFWTKVLIRPEEKPNTYAHTVLKMAINGEISNDLGVYFLKKHFASNPEMPKEEFIRPFGKKRVEKLLRVYGDKCVFCGVKMITDGMGQNPDSITIEHILPISKGGPKHIDNCTLSCHRCNSNKGSHLTPMAPELVICKLSKLGKVRRTKQ